MRKLPYLALCALLFVSGARAADLQKLVQDTQRLAQSGNQMTLVFWMPTAFWETSVANNPAMTADARAQVVAALQDYSVFAVVHAKTGLGGVVEASSKDELLQNSRLEIGGKPIEALAPDAISPAAQTLLATLKPSFAGMLGSFGKSMELLVYPNRQDGKPLLDESKPGAFRYTLYEQVFNWRLPLPSLLPPRVDPKTNEEFPGNYDFNPYTGGKLQTRK
jgi:UDP-N-acetylglucosamine transferase subunit ALG13